VALWISLATALGLGAFVTVQRQRINMLNRQVESDIESLREAIALVEWDYCGIMRVGAARLGEIGGPEPVWTFRQEFDPEGGGIQDPYQYLPTLTSPHAFIEEYPIDPHTGQMYGYWTRMMLGRWEGEYSVAFILTSGGPDGDHDLDEREALLACDIRSDHHPVIGPGVIAHLYDPTNGLHSDGDLVYAVENYRLRVLHDPGRRWQTR
jgi:hypothetical protein